MEGIILVLGLALIIGLHELKSSRDDKKMDDIRELHQLHRHAMRAEMAGLNQIVRAALDGVSTDMNKVLAGIDDEKKASQKLIGETKAKLEQMYANFELKTRLADEHNSNFDTIEM